MLPLHSHKSGLLLLSVLTMSTSCNPARGRFKIFTHLVLYPSDWWTKSAFSCICVSFTIFSPYHFNNFERANTSSWWSALQAQTVLRGGCVVPSGVGALAALPWNTLAHPSLGWHQAASWSLFNSRSVVGKLYESCAYLIIFFLLAMGVFYF